MTPIAGSSSLGPLERAVEERLETMKRDAVLRSIYRSDYTVWSKDPTEISDRLGWLHLPGTMKAHVAELEGFASTLKNEGVTKTILLGMGGSSLAPQVLAQASGIGPATFEVLDTTHPDAVAAIAQSVDPSRTTFIVASKSGTTLETLSQYRYFSSAFPEARFVAITDPGTPLESLAHDDGFEKIFLNPPDIGGRYSALSLFGLVPAAMLGMNLELLLRSADTASKDADDSQSDAAWLGAAIGEAALAGRDKLTFLVDNQISLFGDWAEQLIAESTGKHSKGIVPVVGEPIGPVDVYGSDRIFLSMSEGIDVSHLIDAGHPVIRMPPVDVKNLGAAFFIFELAVSIAGYVLQINPFDQPNVSEAKEATARRLAGRGDQMGIGFDDASSLLDGIEQGDYLALQMFLCPSAAISEQARRIRTSLRDRFGVATTAGYGPRFLHSTGQLHKGGPAGGAFIQFVDEKIDRDIAIPGSDFGFRRLIQAQADGDLESLRTKGRRVTRTTMGALLEALEAKP
ncbi:MAG: glucose-6-phosphate isomerase [Actinomycetota bacterium]|nr:glucose-6-phosphate isomerase [Actinomycetota bacterium]